MTNLLQNGDFNDLGKYWTGEHVTYSDNKANIANVGYIQQEVTLSSAIPAGTLVSISFDLSGMYGSSVTVSLNGESFPSIKEEGHHDIAIVVSNDSDTLKLRFRATNAFTIDNVVMTAQTECVPVDVIKNGDFNDLGKYWTGEHVTYSDNKANIANVGYIQQEVTLSSAIPAGTLVSISFDLSGMYGSSVTVSLNGESFPSIKEEGHHDIAIVVSNDSDTLKLRFRATNAFTLDNVKLFVCT